MGGGVFKGVEEEVSGAGIDEGSDLLAAGVEGAGDGTVGATVWVAVDATEPLSGGALGAGWVVVDDDVDALGNGEGGLVAAGLLNGGAKLGGEFGEFIRG